MNWKPGGPLYLISDPAGFMINRATVNGNICYMAVKLGKPWSPRTGETAPRGWTGSKVLRVERNIDPWDEPARVAALLRCKAACADFVEVADV